MDGSTPILFTGSVGWKYDSWRSEYAFVSFIYLIIENIIGYEHEVSFGGLNLFHFQYFIHQAFLDQYSSSSLVFRRYGSKLFLGIFPLLVADTSPTTSIDGGSGL